MFYWELRPRLAHCGPCRNRARVEGEAAFADDYHVQSIGCSYQAPHGKVLLHVPMRGLHGT
jgi:hypothetical protein